MNTSHTQIGHAWVKQMAPENYLVQHAIVPSYKEAAAWLHGHSSLQRVRVVATQLHGRTVGFALVTGPFTTKAEAHHFVNGRGIPKNTQIRLARSLKEQLLH